MNTCETCKFWEQGRWLPVTHGECHRAQTIDSFDDPTGELVVSTDKAAILITKIGFGCILWEER